MNNIDTAESELRDLLKRNKVKLEYGFSFPHYTEIPDDIRLAISILKKHKLQITVSLIIDNTLALQ